LSLEWRANDFILYGRGGEIATNRLEDQEATMLALHLLQNCMVYVNTLMLQRVLGEPIWLEHMGAKEQRALTPLFLGSREPLWHLPARHDRSSTT
jgi:TnpA family transposase